MVTDFDRRICCRRLLNGGRAAPGGSPSCLRVLQDRAWIQQLGTSKTYVTARRKKSLAAALSHHTVPQGVEQYFKSAIISTGPSRRGDAGAYPVYLAHGDSGRGLPSTKK
jgi:hypothetical protein